MKRNLLWLTVYLVALLMLLPAKVLNWAPLPDNVSLSHVSGSLWQGSIGQLSVRPQPGQQLVLNNVSWDWQWSALLSGAMGVQVTAPAQNNPLAVNARLQLGFSSLNVDDLNASGDLSALMHMANVSMPLPTRGRWTLQADHFSVTEPSPQKWCDELQGQAQGLGIQVRVNGRWQSLGDFPVQLGCTQQGAVELAMSGNNSLGLNFTGSVNSQDMAIRGTVKPNPRTPEGLAKMLTYLGQPDAQGRYRFSF